MLDYPQLEKLLVVEKQGSIAAAARFLDVSTSAVSQHVTGIEEKIGLAVIERAPTRLTKYGRPLCRHFELTQALESQLVLDHGHLFNTDIIDPTPIKTAFDDNLQCRCLIDRLEVLEDNQSIFQLNAIQVLDETALKKMVCLETVSAITGNNTQHYGFRTHYLGELPCWAVASPEFVAENFPDGPDKNCFLSSDTAAYDIGNDLISRFLREKIGQPTYKVPSPHGVLNLCLNGSAWAIFPEHLVDRYIAEGRLENIAPGEELYLPIYWHVIDHLDDIPPIVTETVKAAAINTGMRDGVPG